jgi:hypothetical protein
MRRMMLATMVLMAGGGLHAAEPARPADGVESIGADPRVRQEVVRWMEDLHGSAAGAKDFVLEQAPLVLREMVALGRVEATATMALLLALSLAGMFVLRYLVRAEWIDWKGSNPDVVIPACLGLTCAFCLMTAPLVAAVHCFHWLAAAWFAPRLYVVEELARLIGVAHGR